MATSTIKQVINNSDTGYCKMPDGTMICHGTSVIASGTDRVTISYNQFTDNPTIAFSVSGSGSYRVNYVAKYYAIIVCNEGNVTSDKTIYWIAIGRWK